LVTSTMADAGAQNEMTGASSLSDLTG